MPAIPSCVLSDKNDELIPALRTAHATTDADSMNIHMNRSRKALNAFLDAVSNLCYNANYMLSRIIVSVAMTAALFTAPAGLASRSCILSSAPVEQACKPDCCANKTCCATSSEHKSTPSQPLTKGDSSYKVNAPPVALPMVPPSPEFGAQQFPAFNARCSAHSPPTLALICIRLI